MKIEIVDNWNVFTPTVYRLLERKYVDEFFSTGKLMLSTYSRFLKHENEQRKDNEGANIVVCRSPNLTAYAVVKHGHDALVLCGTARRPTRDILRLFNVDAAIQIFDTVGFGNTLAKSIPGYLAGMEGHCYYSDDAIETKVPDSDLLQFINPKPETQVNLSALGMYYLNIAGSSVFFRKDEKYSNQYEYRWLWLLKEPMEDHLLIDAPEAREYCLPWYMEE